MRFPVTIGREMARKILQYRWLLSRTDELLMRKSSLGLSRYTHAWRRSNQANEQKESLLSQERVRTARPPYDMSRYQVETAIRCLWFPFERTEFKAANMFLIYLALCFWICLLYFWVIISCFDYVYDDSPISRHKEWFSHDVQVAFLWKSVSSSE